MLGITLAIAALGLLCVAGFVFTHLRSLSSTEIERLATKRRLREAAAYFRFSRIQRAVDSRFKSGMHAPGRFYRVTERLSEWPDLAAGLLKYKKHEWIMVALERNREVCQLWLNKGPNNATVSSVIPIAEIAACARAQQCTSVLIFHNHPNPNPARYDCTRPSETDRRTSALWAPQFSGNGLNLIEFVCERGRHFEYHRTYAESFLPRADFVRVLAKTNGQSRLRNLALHWERVFG